MAFKTAMVQYRLFYLPELLVDTTLDLALKTRYL